MLTMGINTKIARISHTGSCFFVEHVFFDLFDLLFVRHNKNKTPLVHENGCSPVVAPNKITGIVPVYIPAFIDFRSYHNYLHLVSVNYSQLGELSGLRLLLN